MVAHLSQRDVDVTPRHTRRSLRENLVAKIPAQEPRGAEVSLPPENCRDLLLDVEEREPRSLAGREFHEDIDIAVRTEIVAQNRPKQRQPANVPATTNIRESSAIDRNLDWHAMPQRRAEFTSGRARSGLSCAARSGRTPAWL